MFAATPDGHHRTVALLAHATAEPSAAMLNYVNGANLSLSAGDREGATRASRAIATERVPVPSGAAAACSTATDKR
jgi:hypothetical protein